MTFANQIMQKPIDSYPVINSQWSDTSNWGILGPRKRVEVLFTSGGECYTIRLVFQSFLGRLLSWVSKPFGWNKESYKTIEVLQSDERTMVVWKNALKDLGPDICSEIFNKVNSVPKKTPAELEVQINETVPLLITLHDLITQFPSQIEHFGSSIQNEWENFINATLHDPKLTIKEKEKLLTEKQAVIVNKCREGALQMIDEMMEGVAKEGNVNEIVPFKERFLSIAQPGAPGFKQIINQREQFWKDLREKVGSLNSIAELDTIVGQIYDEQLTDVELFDILKKNSSKGIAGCLAEAQNRAIKAFGQLSKNIQSPPSNALLLELLKHYHKLFNDPANPAKLTETQREDTLIDFNSYFQCINLMEKSVQVKQEQASVRDDSYIVFPPTNEVASASFKKELNKNKEARWEKMVHQTLPLTFSEITTAYQIMDGIQSYYEKNPEYYLLGKTRHSLPIACIDKAITGAKNAVPTDVEDSYNTEDSLGIYDQSIVALKNTIAKSQDSDRLQRFKACVLSSEFFVEAAVDDLNEYRKGIENFKSEIADHLPPAIDNAAIKSIPLYDVLILLLKQREDLDKAAAMQPALLQVIDPPKIKEIPSTKSISDAVLVAKKDSTLKIKENQQKIDRIKKLLYSSELRVASKQTNPSLDEVEVGKILSLSTEIWEQYEEIRRINADYQLDKVDSLSPETLLLHEKTLEKLLTILEKSEDQE